MAQRPPGTYFCCGASHQHPRCDDCPMLEWSSREPATFVKFCTCPPQFVGSLKDGYWVRGSKRADTYEELVESWTNQT